MTWRCCSPAGDCSRWGTVDLDPALATAISRAYNDWLADFCGGRPSTSSGGRLFGAAMIPPQDIEGAVAEARRAVKELGFKTVFVRPNPVAGRNWHDPYYDPLWAEVQNLGVPLSFHEGGRVNLPQPGDNFDTHMLYHTCTHPLGMMLAAVDIVGGGVLERFPELTVAFLEGNCSWAPWLLWRLDEHWEMSASYDHPDLKMAAERVLPAPMLPVSGVRRGTGGDSVEVRAGGQYRLLNGLSPRRLEVPAVSGPLPGTAAVGRRQAQVPVGQLRAAVWVWLNAESAENAEGFGDRFTGCLPDSLRRLGRLGSSLICSRLYPGWERFPRPIQI